MANRWLCVGASRDTVRGNVNSGETTSYRRGSHTKVSIAPSINTGAGAYQDFRDDAGALDKAMVGETLFASVYIGFISANNTGDHIFLCDDEDRKWAGFKQTTAFNFSFVYNSGTIAAPVWTVLGDWGASGTGWYVVALTLGDPHALRIFKSDVLVAEAEFSSAELTNIASWGWFQASSSRYTYSSEHMATVGINLVGAKLYERRPNAAGFYQQFTGAYTAVDDPVTDDGDDISTTTAGQKSTFTFDNAPTLGVNEAVGPLNYIVRCRNDGVSPNNIKPVKRSGGVDAVGSAYAGINSGFSGFSTRYTGLTEAQIAAVELGVESAA